MLLLVSYFLLFTDASSFQIPSDIALRIENDEIIFAADNPLDGFYPNIGNGFIGRNVGCYKHSSSSTINNVDTQIGQTPCGSLYMSGIYNGYLNTKIHANSGEPHRARIPGIHSYYIQSNTKNDNYEIKWIGAYIDLVNGTVNNRSQIFHPTKCSNNGQPIDIEVISYTHRSLRSLMILNISIVNISNLASNLSCTIPLLNCNSNYTNDIKWTESVTNDNGYNIILRNMQTLVNVTVNTTTFGIGAAYQKIDNNVILTNDKPTISYYAVLHNSLPLDTGITNNTALTEYCENELMNYLNKYDSNEMFDLHRNRMKQLFWNTRVEVNGNQTIKLGLYASYYYLVNAIRPDYPFPIGPGGINTNDYSGHQFWDMETWMLPYLTMTNLDLAKAMIKYRLNRIYAAERYSVSNGYCNFADNCAEYPWESCYSGDMASWFSNQEIHINGDVIMAARKIYWATQNASWFINTISNPPQSIHRNEELKIKYNFWNMSYRICNFFDKLFVKSPQNSNLYTIYNVVPPDEKAGIVNSSIYTNAIGSLALKWCLNVSNILNKYGYNINIDQNKIDHWNDIIDNTYLPMTDTSKLNANNTIPNNTFIHLEYETYNGQYVNQADVALLQYPLYYFNDQKYGIFVDYNQSILIYDLLYYQLKTEQGNSAHFFTGDSAYSIAWLKMNNISNAQIFFDDGFQHMDSKYFYIFVEKASSNGGHLNFLTGVGGLLQNVLYGYAGLTITQQYAYFNPVLPLVSTTNITDIKFHSLTYKGVEFELEYDKENINIGLIGNNDDSFNIDTLIIDYNNQKITVNKTYKLTYPNNVMFARTPFRIS